MLAALRSALLAAALWVFALPAFAAIGTPVVIASGQTASTVTSFDITGVSANAGQGIFVWVATGSAATAPACGGGSGDANTYTVTSIVTGLAAARYWLCYVPNPSAISSGTLHVAWTGSSKVVIVALQISGLDLSTPLDKTGTPQNAASGTQTSPNATTTTTAQATEIAIAMNLVNQTPGTFTESGNGSSTGDLFSAPTPTFSSAHIQQASGGVDMDVSYRQLSSTGTPAYGALWTNSHSWISAVWTFKAAAAAGAVARHGLLTGVYP